MFTRCGGGRSHVLIAQAGQIYECPLDTPFIVVGLIAKMKKTPVEIPLRAGVRRHGGNIASALPVSKTFPAASSACTVQR
jgi:hypothetical protein